MSHLINNSSQRPSGYMIVCITLCIINKRLIVLWKIYYFSSSIAEPGVRVEILGQRLKIQVYPKAHVSSSMAILFIEKLRVMFYSV